MPMIALTYEDVRRIVREEMDKRDAVIGAKLEPLIERINRALAGL